MGLEGWGTRWAGGAAAAAAAVCCWLRRSSADKHAASPPRREVEPAGAAVAGGDEGVPVVLRLICPEWEWLQGNYALSRASVTEGARGKEHVGWNHMPVWIGGSDPDTQYCIFSDQEGVWKIGEHLREDMEQGIGYIKARQPHRGALPQHTREWLRSVVTAEEEEERCEYSPRVRVVVVS
eukprot:TRINITY_DN70457_c0_g1_i1.p2 TRINITY_DN70457_c0_g1~~TRINITY_DN70457_c0_g1_i1.p2  ORF type:complete len:200 (+),score=59.85 TRINITY_DN70457_c0_g1_i1:63-602(+)